MSKTLLNGVNEVLKRASLIQGDSGSLSTLSDSARQLWIDTAVQVWNEALVKLFTVAELPMPTQLAENTITLATSDRSYAIASGAYHALHFPLLDETNGQYIHEWKQGYLHLVSSQPVPADYTGLPQYGAINPVNSELYLDRIPTASENGLVYKYRYDKDFTLSAAANTFPFQDSVFLAMVPAVTELFNLAHKKEFAEGLYKDSMGDAARLLLGKKPRTHYGRTAPAGDGGIFAPFN